MTAADTVGMKTDSVRMRATRALKSSCASIFRAAVTSLDGRASCSTGGCGRLQQVLVVDHLLRLRRHTSSTPGSGAATSISGGLVGPHGFSL